MYKYIYVHLPFFNYIDIINKCGVIEIEIKLMI